MNSTHNPHHSGFTASSTITSGQVEVHERLLEIVQKHLREPYQKPIATHTLTVFEQSRTWIESALALKADRGASIILDSCCGTGESTYNLALEHPDSFVIGIDQSEHRLSKSPSHNYDSIRERVLLLRADIIDFWRLCYSASFAFDKLYILYPNPYPKAKHIQRRWHGHPILPTILSLSQHIELRTNWNIYAQEFSQALNFCNRPNTIVEIQDSIVNPLTPFERKYAQSGHLLYKVQG
jgi:tRNA G46 methylase TrmB